MALYESTVPLNKTLQIRKAELTTSLGDAKNKLAHIAPGSVPPSLEIGLLRSELTEQIEQFAIGLFAIDQQLVINLVRGGNLTIPEAVEILTQTRNQLGFPGENPKVHPQGDHEDQKTQQKPSPTEIQRTSEERQEPSSPKWIIQIVKPKEKGKHGRLRSNREFVRTTEAKIAVLELLGAKQSVSIPELYRAIVGDTVPEDRIPEYKVQSQEVFNLIKEIREDLGFFKPKPGERPIWVIPYAHKEHAHTGHPSSYSLHADAKVVMVDDEQIEREEKEKFKVRQEILAGVHQAILDDTSIDFDEIKETLGKRIRRRKNVITLGFPNQQEIAYLLSYHVKNIFFQKKGRSFNERDRQNADKIIDYLSKNELTLNQYIKILAAKFGTRLEDAFGPLGDKGVEALISFAKIYRGTEKQGELEAKEPSYIFSAREAALIAASLKFYKKELQGKELPPISDVVLSRLEDKIPVDKEKVPSRKSRGTEEDATILIERQGALKKLVDIIVEGKGIESYSEVLDSNIRDLIGYFGLLTPVQIQVYLQQVQEGLEQKVLLPDVFVAKWVELNSQPVLSQDKSDALDINPRVLLLSILPKAKVDLDAIVANVCARLDQTGYVTFKDFEKIIPEYNLGEQYILRRNPSNNGGAHRKIRRFDAIKTIAMKHLKGLSPQLIAELDLLIREKIDTLDARIHTT